MKNSSSLLYSFILLVGDFLALLGAFVLAYILRVKFDDRPLPQQIPATTYLLLFVVLLIFWLMIFALLGLYQSRVYEKRLSEAGRILAGCFIGILFLIGAEYVLNRPIFPARLVPVYGLGLSFLLVLLFRTIARGTRHTLFNYGIGLNHVLLVGATDITKELVTRFSSKKSGFKIIGIAGDRRVSYPNIPDNLQFTDFEEAITKLKKTTIHSIVQTELFADQETNSEVLTYAQENHIAYRFIPGNSELFAGKIEADLFYSIPVIAVHQTALVGWGRIVKRLFDLTAGTILLVLASPIMLIVSLLIKLEDGGAVFLRQTRLTRFDRKFKVFKFRSHNKKYNGLTPDQAFEKMQRPDLLKQFRDNGNFLANDPRETRIGRLIRKLSIDELPQLFNVLKGDLSLVGPRALIPNDLAQYRRRHTILSVKSGITGLAQVSGRNNIPPEQRRALDIYYAQNWSFWLDLTILARTITTILTHEEESNTK